MEIETIIMTGLAIWRISSMLVNERGPFGIFQTIREWTGIEHDPDGFAYKVPDGFMAELFSCVWCMSLWVSGAMLIFRSQSPFLQFYFSFWLALSAIAIIVEKWVRR